MIIYLRRIFRFGWHNFFRETGLSLATVFVLTVTIFLFSFLLASQAGVNHIIDQVESKIDISVYLKPDITEDDMNALQEKLQEMPEVQNVMVVSSEDALEQFTNRHKNDPDILESLEVIGTNPFYASLNIRAVEPDQYSAILTVLQSISMEELIHKIDYTEKKVVIDKLNNGINNVNAVGLFLTIILIIVGMLVTFNTIRLAIYDSSEEIGVMRLVGAPNKFIRGPFIIQGIIAGVISALIAFIVFFVVSYISGPKLEEITNGFNSLTWLGSKVFIIFFMQLFSGIVLGVVSSLIAIRKYLTI